MEEFKLNKILFQLSQWSGYGLAAVMILYFISGYGMTKAIIDPVFAKTLHEKWLPIPSVCLILLHICFRLRNFLFRKIKDPIWVNIYILVVSLVILFISFYLYWL